MRAAPFIFESAGLTAFLMLKVRNLTVANIKENKKNLTISELMLLNQLLWLQQMLQLSITLLRSRSRYWLQEGPLQRRSRWKLSNGITWLQRKQIGRNQTGWRAIEKLPLAYHTDEVKKLPKNHWWYGSASGNFYRQKVIVLNKWND